MVTKTMKGVTQEVWAEFKSLAAKNNMKAGPFFERLVYSYKDNADKVWDNILSGEKILTEEEAKDIEKITKRIRKEYGFRI